LSYPEAKEDGGQVAPVAFEEIVCASLCPDQTTPAWCDKCKKYQTTRQTRNLVSLPHILSLNTNVDGEQDVDFWRAQMTALYEKHKPPGSEEAGEEAAAKAVPSTLEAQPPQPPANTKPCRYGVGCTRPDCKFWHPPQHGQDGQEVEAGRAIVEVDVGDRLWKLGHSWVPHEMRLAVDDNGKASPLPANGGEGKPGKKYKLFAVCSVIRDPKSGTPVNVVAAIEVGSTYHARVASPVSQWYIFNDFSINTIMPSEATWFNLTWKLPCILFYAAEEDEPAGLRGLTEANPITDVVFRDDRSLVSGGRKRAVTFTPLIADEMPQKGDLVAIDAEFVTLNQEESELRSDGKISTIKAAQMSVARITCVRGCGPHEGVPFIDDYISTQEQVVDYVTKFSGIQPGDLDANFSSKHLTTLKSTYKKLRYLVDTGCIFIGHGLKNDFKVINLVVPVDQVVDTVLLFHLPHNRMISLKFLAWHFLGERIQGETHDSVEDAVAALKLYRKYLALKAQGGTALTDALNEVYDKGKGCNWKIPGDE